MFTWFKKRIPLDVQLRALRDCGITLDSNVAMEDLCTLYSVKQIETSPYNTILTVLGLDLERAPYTPISNKLWLCDFECIEDAGNYVSVLERLERMSGSGAKLEQLTDFIDHENQRASLEFRFSGNSVRWNLNCDNDWLDPVVLLRYAELLEEARSSVRLYAGVEDHGQSLLLGAFTPSELTKLEKLGGQKFVPLRQLKWMGAKSSSNP